MVSTTLTLNITTGSKTLPDVVAGEGALTKSGAGTLTLSAANTYTGATTVSAGTLSVTGSITSAVTVNSGGTLGGSGTVSAAVTVNSGGTLAPGTSAGILNTNTLTLNSGSTFSVEINGTTAGTDYDQTNVTGTVSLGSAALSVSLGFTPTNGDTFTIINNDGSDAVTGTFSGLAQSATFVSGGRTFQISYSGGSNDNDVVLTVVNGTPTITDIANQTIDEDAATSALAFTIGDTETAASSLTVSGSSSNTTLVPTANIVFGGSGASRTVTVTPAANQNGSATITVTVSDGSASANDTFTLTVNAVSDAPTSPTSPTRRSTRTRRRPRSRLRSAMRTRPPTIWFKALADGVPGSFTYQSGAISPGWNPLLLDLDGNGRSDVFVYNPATGQWATCLTTDTSLACDAVRTWDANWELYPADFNADGKADLFLFNLATGVWVRATNDGARDFTYVSGTWSPIWDVALGDVDGDGRSDVVLYDPAGGLAFTALTPASGAGEFAYAPFAFAAGARAGVGDFDGNGLADVFLYNRRHGRLDASPTDRGGRVRHVQLDVVAGLADLREPL